MSLQSNATGATPLPAERHRRFPLILGFVSLGVLFALSYLRLFGYFWQHWTEEHGPFGYGYLVPPSVAYLLWGNREAIGAAPVTRAVWWAWILCGLAAFANVVAIVSAVTVLQSLSFLALTLVLPYCLWGPARFRPMASALLYSATMIPWPGQIMNVILFDLEHLSVRLAMWMFEALRLGPIADGNTIYLPRFTFDVAPACAGLTILFPTVASMILVAIIVVAPVWRRLLLVVLSVPVSILINGVRILLVGLIGNAGGDSLALTLHDASGIVGVFVCVLILSGIGALIGCGKYDPKYMPAWAREDEE